MRTQGINIISMFNLSGRGTVLETDLRYDDYVYKFNIGDTISYKEKFYEITGFAAMLKRTQDNKKDDFLSFSVKEITEVEKTEKEFVSLLWEMPGHWFSEVNNGVRVMEPISYALYQTFCFKFGYEWGSFDSKVLLPFYFSEKKKYEQLVKTKKDLFGKKTILGMIHLSFDEGDDSRIQRAIREVEVLEQEGVHGIIVENYHGSVQDMKEFFEMAQIVLEKSKLVIGLNILPNEYEEAFKMADEVGAKFIQLDYVSGTYLNHKFIYEPHFMAVRARYPHIVVLGGVWPKYYNPVNGSDLKADISAAMRRADAIVVTGEGTGKETNIEKIEEFRKLTKGFPLFVGAGLTPDNVKEQLSIADGGIVGSSLKRGGITRNEINRELVKRFMESLKK